MPRRRRRQQRSTTGSSRRGTRRSSGATRRQVRIEPGAVLESVLDEIVSKAGLDLLGLERRDYAEILRPIVEGILSGYSSRPSRETLVSKILGNLRPLYMYAAAYLVERFDRLNVDQLEFVVSNAPEIAARNAARLYQELISAGREDLVPLLRKAWEQFGNPTPVTCPYCGFRAVLPNYVCAICGREVKEKDIKAMIDFDSLLAEFVEFYGLGGVREALEKGYVVLKDTIYPPSEEEPLALRLYLSRRDKEKLKNMISRATVQRSSV